MFNASLDWLKEWIIFPVVFVVLFAVFFNFKNSLWVSLESYARQQRASWIFQLLKVSHVPVQVFLVLVAVLISLYFIPQPLKPFESVAFILRTLCFLNLGWLIHLSLGVLVKNRQLLPYLNLSSRALILTFLRLGFLVVMAVVLLDTFGVEVRSVLISFGIGSLPVGLALQDVIRDVFNGFYLLIARPVKIGDFVKVDDLVEGQIVYISWRNTKIQPVNRNVVILPNSKLVQGLLTNFELPSSEVVVSVFLVVPYQVDLAKVETVTLEVAQQVMKEALQVSVLDPSLIPTWKLVEWNEYGMRFYVNLKATKFQDQVDLRHRFLKAIFMKYQQEGIPFPYPRRELLTLSS